MRWTCDDERMIDLFIYYRVQDADAASLQTLVNAMQTGLAQQHGVTGQLKRRPETSDDLQTWMEIYPATQHVFAGALELAVQQAGLMALIVGVRHTEIFTDLTPCA